MHAVTLLDSSPSYSRLQTRSSQLVDAPGVIKTGSEAAVSLPAGSDQTLLWWRTLNHLCTGYGRAKTTTRRLGYIDNTQSVNCDCGELQAMAHLLCLRLLDEPCAPEDLIGITERAAAGKGVCPEVSKCCVKDTRDKAATQRTVQRCSIPFRALRRGQRMSSGCFRHNSFM